MSEATALAAYRARCAQLARDFPQFDRVEDLRRVLFPADYALWARAFGADALADICAQTALDQREIITELIAEMVAQEQPVLIGAYAMGALRHRAREAYLYDIAAVRPPEADEPAESLASQCGVRGVVTGGSVL